VGQAAFFALFQIVAPQYAAAGTSAVTTFQVVYLLLCASGLYWYLSYKHFDLETGPQTVTPAVETPGAGF